MFESVLEACPAEAIVSWSQFFPVVFIDGFKFDGMSVVVGLFDLLTAIDFGLCESVILFVPEPFGVDGLPFGGRFAVTIEDKAFDGIAVGVFALDGFSAIEFFADVF